MIFYKFRHTKYRKCFKKDVKRLEHTHEDKQQFAVRTDLAVEAKEMYVEQKEEKSDIPGVTVKDKVSHGVKVSHIEVSKEGEQTIQKKAGSYITIYADGVKKQDTKLQANAANVLA